MKQITAVLSLLFLFACAKKRESKLFLPIEYEFPEMKAGESKTYVYVDRDSTDSTFCNYDVYSKDGHNLLIASFYSGKITFLNKIRKCICRLFQMIVPNPENGKNPSTAE